RQRKTVKNVARRQRDILTAVDGIADRRRRVIAAGLIMPEIRSRLGVQRDQVSVARRGEQHTAGSREYAVGQRSLKQLEVPHSLAGLRIERLVGGIRRRIVRSPRRQWSCAPLTEIFTTFLRSLWRADVHRARFRVFQIE